MVTFYSGNLCAIKEHSPYWAKSYCGKHHLCSFNIVYAFSITISCLMYYDCNLYFTFNYYCNNYKSGVAIWVWFAHAQICRTRAILWWTVLL